MTLKATKHTNLQGAHTAGPPEASPTAVHTVAQGAEVTVGPGPGPDPLISITAGHPPTADQTLKTPIKHVTTRRIH